jgi:hypothetical protein
MIDMGVIERTKQALKVIGSAGRPVIVGPWLSEVGFEVLYWVPWLRWAVAYAGLRPEDVYIVSRGGAQSWYAGIGAHYWDVLDAYTPADFREAHRQRIAEQQDRASSMGLKHALRSSKQHIYTAVDEDIIQRTCAAFGLRAPQVLHPSLMYAFFRPFWKKKAPGLYRDSTVVRRLAASAVALELPASYVAVKFYSSAALQDTLLHRQVVQQIVATEAQASDVVVLHSGTRYDDHGEFPIAAHPRVHSVNMPPSQNLDIQTAVIAGASRYIGTYGGFAYLAPFLGVPTQAFYGEDNFRSDHRHLMASVCAADLRVRFTVESIQMGSHRAGKARRAA